MDFILRKIMACCLLAMVFFSCTDTNEEFLGVVTSASPEASEAGEEILKKGGNAIDAAIAVSFALAVTEPAMSGLGGGTQVLLSIKDQTPIAINGTTFSPQGTIPSSGDTLTYHRRSTIPSTVKVLDYLYQNYGSGKVSWEELVQPAIAFAENGFEIGPFRGKVYQKYEAKLQESPYNTSLFLIEGKAPKIGQRLKQPILAKTLKRLAKYGADDFYKGEIAQAIASDMEKNNGWITLEDLQNFKAPEELAPLSITYGNHNVYSQPPPCGGWTTLLIMKLIEAKSKGDQITADDIIEALYLGQNDRRKHPVTNLMQYDSMVNEKLSERYVQQLLAQVSDSTVNKEKLTKNSGETTHFSVVDASGTAISVTSSINAYFGSLAASKELGFLYNSYMDDFTFEKPGHPFALRPNAMAYSSMSPTIVQNNGKNVLVIGSPGSSRIISSVAQLTAKWIERQDISKIIGETRVHVNRNRVYLEEKKDTAFVDTDLIEKYHLNFRFPDESLILHQPLNPYYGGIHVIAKEKSSWMGVADPRRDGVSVFVTD